MFCDFLITKVKIWDDECSDIDLKYLLDFAVVQLIHENPYNCGPFNPGDCEMTWRVNKNACWKKTQQTMWEPTSEHYYWGNIGPCGLDDICCLTWYQVCVDQWGQRIVTKIQETSTGDCPFDPMGECIPVCGN